MGGPGTLEYSAFYANDAKLDNRVSASHAGGSSATSHPGGGGDGGSPGPRARGARPQPTSTQRTKQYAKRHQKKQAYVPKVRDAQEQGDQPSSRGSLRGGDGHATQSRNGPGGARRDAVIGDRNFGGRTFTSSAAAAADALEDLDAQVEAAADVLADIDMCQEAFDATGILCDDPQEAAEMLLAHRAATAKALEASKVEAIAAAKRQAELERLSARRDLRCKRIRDMQCTWREAAVQGWPMFLIKLLMSAKTLLLLASICLWLLGASDYQFVLAYLDVLKHLRNWWWGLFLAVVSAVLLDAVETQRGNSTLYLSRYHVYSFLRWYEEQPELDDVRADLGAVSENRHKDPYYCWVRYTTQIRFLSFVYVMHETDMIVSAELLTQLLEGAVMRDASSPFLASRKIAETASRYQFVNLDRDVGLIQIVKENTAKVAYGFYEQQRDLTKHVPFPLSPSL